MGAIRDFFFPEVKAANNVDVTAALTPVQIQDQIYNILGGATNTTRAMAMSVPSVARARNIICGTIGSLPLTTFNRISFLVNAIFSATATTIDAEGIVQITARESA